MLYTVLSALPVVSHVPLFLKPYAVSQVLAFFEAFPLSPGYSVHPFLRCRSTLPNVHEYYYTMTCLLKRNKLHYCLTNMCLASFCACANVCGRLMTYKHTYKHSWHWPHCACPNNHTTLGQHWLLKLGFWICGVMSKAEYLWLGQYKHLWLIYCVWKGLGKTIRFIHGKSIVVFHCSSFLLQDSVCNSAVRQKWNYLCQMF